MKILTAFVSLILFSTLAMAQDIPMAGSAPALVSTSGVGKVYVQPDEVHFTININTEGEDLVAAKTANAELASKALSYLKQQGIEDRYVQTAYMNISVQYRDRAQQDPRYIANQSIRVCLKDVKRYEPITIGLLERGITGLQGPRFANTKQEEHEADARRLAVIDAREKAEAMAGALGQQIGKAYMISNVDNGRNPGMVYARSAMMEMDNSGSGPGIAVGELEISESVDVSFYLRN